MQGYVIFYSIDVMVRNVVLDESRLRMRFRTNELKFCSVLRACTHTHAHSPLPSFLEVQEML